MELASRDKSGDMADSINIIHFGQNLPHQKRVKLVKDLYKEAE